MLIRWGATSCDASLRPQLKAPYTSSVRPHTLVAEGLIHVDQVGRDFLRCFQVSECRPLQEPRLQLCWYSAPPHITRTHTLQLHRTHARTHTHCSYEVFPATSLVASCSLSLFSLSLSLALSLSLLSRSRSRSFALALSLSLDLSRPLL